MDTTRNPINPIKSEIRQAVFRCETSAKPPAVFLLVGGGKICSDQKKILPLRLNFTAVP
jgi:hypothetical protein